MERDHASEPGCDGGFRRLRYERAVGTGTSAADDGAVVTQGPTAVDAGGVVISAGCGTMDVGLVTVAGAVSVHATSGLVSVIVTHVTGLVAVVATVFVPGAGCSLLGDETTAVGLVTVEVLELSFSFGKKQSDRTLSVFVPARDSVNSCCLTGQSAGGKVSGKGVAAGRSADEML